MKENLCCDRLGCVICILAMPHPIIQCRGRPAHTVSLLSSKHKVINVNAVPAPSVPVRLVSREAHRVPARVRRPPELQPSAANVPRITAVIAEYVASRVAHYKRLGAGVVVVDVIPKSPSGKILRKELRARVAQEQADAEKARL